MEQKRSLGNLVLGMLYPCFLFSYEAKESPLQKRLRRKHNRIWLCRHIDLYVQRWYAISLLLGIAAVISWPTQKSTLVEWVLLLLFIVSLGTLYLMIELKQLHPPELEIELKRQLAKHDSDKEMGSDS